MSSDSFLDKKSLGILVHPSCLPGGTYCGTFGQGLVDWLEILSNYNIKIWQFLPLTPTDSKGSPYSSPSSFALNPWFLDLDELVKSGYIMRADLAEFGSLKDPNLDYFEFDKANDLTNIFGNSLLASWSQQGEDIKSKFYCWLDNNPWVDDYSIFMVLKYEFRGAPWWEWPEEFRFKNKEKIESWRKNNHSNILIQQLIQWHLNRQWLEIKKIAKLKGIKLIGDLPFYVSRDSVDVWSNKSLFSLSIDGNMLFQSGVPPDYFSSSGQLWGTPVYHWVMHTSTGFDWWKKRFKRQYELVDILRLDHFRALAGYWRVDCEAKNAINGKWIKSPGMELLKSLKNNMQVKTLPIIAEDLGVITDDVVDLRNKFDLPGMKILQFAFDGNQNNPYLPKNIKGDNWVVYTGTHDNSTSLSWWDDLDDFTKRDLEIKYQFKRNPSWNLIELGMKTNAKLFVAPIQDILSLDDSSRLNKPGTITNNWKWKLNKSIKHIEPYIEEFANLGRIYSRVNF